MTWTVIASAEADASGAGTTLDAVASLALLDGDALVCIAKHEGTPSGTFTLQKDTGSPANAFTFDNFDRVNHTNNDLSGWMGYVLNCAADPTATFRFTTDSKTFRGFVIYQCRATAGATIYKDGSNKGQGTGAAAASGTINAAGTSIVFGCYCQFANQNLSAREINNVAADAFQDAGTTDLSLWYRILSAGFTAGAADVTGDVADAWICNILALGESTGGMGLPANRIYYTKPYGAGGLRE